MHKQESILENLMHEILCDFEIQNVSLIPTSRLDFVLINKKRIYQKWILLFRSAIM